MNELLTERVASSSDRRLLSIGVILASVREGRRGEILAKWVVELLGQSPDVHAELLDLRDFELGAWTERIPELDAFVIVTPEYNHGYPGELKTALDSLYNPWNHKPVAFVSYGFSANGARAVEQLRQVVGELRMVAVRDEVNLRVGAYATNERGFPADQGALRSARAMVEELLWWGRLLQEGRRQRALTTAPA
ncbi:NADPH-dependent FMN reductase [Pendulispora albinea]|uniref:NAD(P)H-dependent oxidoreductase n=1 Tax=Pendulispora albinea TaxID=2741071 RepID=A0ABZ2M685_9BACT